MEKEKIKNIIGRELDYTFNFVFTDVVEDIIDRIDFDNEDIYGECYQAIDEGLIYTKDQWIVYQYYCSPQESFDQAMECFTSDIIRIAEAIKEEL